MDNMTEKTVKQFCEDCTHCIQKDGVDRPHYLSKCRLHPEDNPDSRVSRQEVVKEDWLFCSVVRTEDTCENYEVENINPEYDPSNDNFEHFEEHEPQRRHNGI